MKKEAILIISFLSISLFMSTSAQCQTDASNAGQAPTSENVEAANDSVIAMVYTTFIVDKRGFVKDAEIVNTECDSCDVEIIRECEKEAMRIIDEMPRWERSYQEVQYNLPMRFALPKESSNEEKEKN